MAEMAENGLIDWKWFAKAGNGYKLLDMANK